MMTRTLTSALAAIALIFITDSASTASQATDPIRNAILHLKDQDGRTVDAARFAGNYILVNFIFTSCATTCPTQTAELVQLDRTLPRSVRSRLTFLSISVDPKKDTPAKLKLYARSLDADGPRWTFATGSRADIARITRDFAVFRPGENAAGFHTSEVRLFDPAHRMLQRYAGAPLASRQLRADLMTLMPRRS